ncbi:glutamate-ammonia-ligase adenylyltransferase [bacterium BMS3Abin07]|nr:glutamate-ammonia-ligase adenylyltransferase [bacterium BMS3Abin07]GBE31690.1 glutamate-ammonia-ligase adenylyltransferase [bacterium BMS3Bbin05]
MNRFKEVSGKTPDPERALKNIETFLQVNPEFRDKLQAYIRPIANLFAYSQYLANYSVRSPHALFKALDNLKKIEHKREMFNELTGGLTGQDYEEALRVFREFKKEKMIGITVRDIMGISDITGSMEQMSDLADAVIHAALNYIKEQLERKFGAPEDYSFAVFALGKLGAQELNYSSDVDIIFVYGGEEGHTTGAGSPMGGLINIIDNHEFYCRLATETGKFLSLNTGDGFVYRVDMRLRPDGQRGDAALSLGSYELYYESFGREWERLALIRARFVCGDESLGKDFIEMIQPFLWRKYIDFSTIDEIRSLKTRIDATFRKDDIKRGYGGIREIEFFIQSLQLIYGGREPVLRQRKTLIALYMLKQKNLIGDDDHILLAENYIYLRKVEHYIQMLNDVQTHVIPSGKGQREALARKLGYRSMNEFVKDLEKRRLMIRDTYNLLFKPGEGVEEQGGAGFFLDADIGDEVLREYLLSRGVPDTADSMKHINKIREGIISAHSLKGRKILRVIMPGLVDEALSTPAAGTALKNLVRFMDILSANEPYLRTFMDSDILSKALLKVFSQSDYLTRIILGNPEYLDILSGGATRRKTLLLLKNELKGMVKSGMSLNYAVRVFKRSEEIRLGLVFLNRQIDVWHFVRGLTKVAESIVDIAAEETGMEMKVPPGNNVYVAAMGKFGGREITIGSDLDILFFVEKEISDLSIRSAEKFLRLMQAYTKDGIAYRIDTRLRPDGSKGPLVNDIKGYRNYYMKHAGNWEIQALLKARPVSASRDGVCAFMKIRDEILRLRACEITRGDFIDMRSRIMKELRKPGTGIDIKLDSGGIEEIEFAVQFLQLRYINALKFIPQGTVNALKILGRIGALESEDMKYLSDSYGYYRSIESYLRLSLKNVVNEGDKEIVYLSEFMGFDSTDEFLSQLHERMGRVAEIAHMLYES